MGAACSWLVLLSLWAAACSWLVILSLWALRVHGWSFSACGRCVFMADPSQPVGAACSWLVLLSLWAAACS